MPTLEAAGIVVQHLDQVTLNSDKPLTWTAAPHYNQGNIRLLGPGLFWSLSMSGIELKYPAKDNNFSTVTVGIDAVLEMSKGFNVVGTGTGAKIYSKNNIIVSDVDLKKAVEKSFYLYCKRIAGAKALAHALRSTEQKTERLHMDWAHNIGN